MSRVFSIGTALVLIGGALAGCSASLPNWMSATSSTPPPQPLQFQSEPPAADVRTAQGQTCQTPCSLTVPSENQAIIFTKNGFLPQTVQIAVGAPPEHSLFESAPPPSLTLNPVVVTLQPVAPPKRAVKHRPPQARFESPLPGQVRHQPQRNLRHHRRRSNSQHIALAKRARPTLYHPLPLLHRAPQPLPLQSR
jgi:hypothetical protein